MANYQWILCQSPSNDDPFAPLQKIGDLSNAKNRSFQLVQNRAGSASFSLRTNDDLVPEILDGIDLNDIRGTIKKCIRIRRDDVDLWSGPIWGIQGDFDGGTLQFSCVGWLELLQHAMIWQTLDYSNSGFGEPDWLIVSAMLNSVNSQDLAHPLKVRMSAPPPGYDVDGKFQTRNRFYTQGTMVGPSIQELSDIEAGFNMEVDPVTRELKLSSWDSFTIHRDIVLGYNWGPNNLKNATWQEDASKTVNSMRVQSLGAPIGPVTDSTSQDDYGNFEQLVSLTGANQDVLTPYAVEELVIYSRPFVSWSVLPFPGKAPLLFEDFQMGDQIYFSAVKDYVKILRQAIRIFGATVNLDDNGNETISSLQLTATGTG